MRSITLLARNSTNNLLTVLRLTASSKDTKAREWIVGFGISEELRCGNYVVGTALFELRCENLGKDQPNVYVNLLLYLLKQIFEFLF